MQWARAVISILALLEAGWMAFDGGRALVTGDFITPKTGPHAGQVGPWRHLVEGVGLNPRGTPVKAIFAIYGLAWLAVTVGFLRGADWGWTLMLVSAIGALWFLPFGTLFSLIQIVLLVAFRHQLR